MKHGFDLSIPSSATKPNGGTDKVPLKSQLLNSAPSGLIEQAFMDAYFLNYHSSYPLFMKLPLGHSSTNTFPAHTASHGTSF